MKAIVVDCLLGAIRENRVCVRTVSLDPDRKHRHQGEAEEEHQQLEGGEPASALRLVVDEFLRDDAEI